MFLGETETLSEEIVVNCSNRLRMNFFITNVLRKQITSAESSQRKTTFTIETCWIKDQENKKSSYRTSLRQCQKTSQRSWIDPFETV